MPFKRAEHTLFTRAIMANTAESAMSVARMPAAASSRAICWPWYVGAPSVTTTWADQDGEEADLGAMGINQQVDGSARANHMHSCTSSMGFCIWPR